MAYTTVNVIVAGALGSSEDYADDDANAERFDADMWKLRHDAETEGFYAEVFTLFHDHEYGECECTQYVTDHHPAFTYGVE
jgi:hypothetical protein